MMNEAYKIAYEGGMGEITLKKSRFIATVHPIETEEAAITFIENTKKKFWDATHNCFAYVVGFKNEIQRCSDDGEPSGTAGKPILDIILGEEIHNVAVVVTRYFGGNLLGTGGLVRAYSNAAKEGIKNSVIIQKCFGRKYCIKTDYIGVGKLQYTVSQMELITIDTEYTDIVKMHVLAPMGKAETFKKKVIEVTSGTAVLEMEEEVYFSQVSGKVIFW